ncbi:MAG: glycine--tRNA ligase subunit beta [Sphingomonas sp.]
MTDFLLELRSEEIPARMQRDARTRIQHIFAEQMLEAGVSFGEMVAYSTPRRLVLIATNLPTQTAAVREEIKGPRTSAPPQALDGFLRKTGLSRDQLEDRDGIWFANIERPGRETRAVLSAAISHIVRHFGWPKSMRWGDASASTESLRWVRPLQGIVALLGEEVVPFEIAGIASGSATLGHRFHHPGAITIGSAADYVEKLRACHVIVDQDERAAIIRDAATKLAADAGLELIEDEGLVAENAGLTEWPVPLLGRFDAAFLDVPPEVIQLTARVNQKYFVCRETVPLPPAGGARGGPVSEAGDDKPFPDPSRTREGRLANAFICTANIAASDGGAKIVEGNRKVLAARLSDAKFFYETDLKTRLEDQLPKLEKIVFHEKLGTVADKVERVAKLARWLVESNIVTPAKAGVSGDGAGQEPQEMPASAGMTKEALAALAERAARLAKADLVTGMVGEFPELQGLMGGYYAAAQGEPQEVAEAIRDHYKPVGQGDDVPTAPVTVAVSLADKLDTLTGFFFADEKPTGSKDPYALRRAALGVLQILERTGIRLPMTRLVNEAAQQLNLHVATNLFKSEPLTQILARGMPSAMALSPMAEDGTHEVSIDGINVAAVDTRFVEPILNWIQRSMVSAAWRRDLLDFFADRLKVQQREAGVRHDLIDAVFALGGEDDLVRLLARVKALQAFVGTEDGANLLTGYRRAANILKKEGWDAALQPTRHPGLDPGSGLPVDEEEAGPRLGGRGDVLGYEPQPEEAALIAALDAAAPAAASAVAREDFEAAMAALATLRAPIDAFFDAVTVNDADPAKRDARLALLARIRDAVHGVADFSKIEG